MLPRASAGFQSQIMNTLLFFLHRKSNFSRVNRRLLDCMMNDKYDEGLMLATYLGEELVAATPGAFRVWLNSGGKDLQAFLAQNLSVSAVLIVYSSTFP